MYYSKDGCPSFVARLVNLEEQKEGMMLLFYGESIIVFFFCAIFAPYE